MEKNKIIIYTDGSCNTNYNVGAWAAVICYNNLEKILSNYELKTTHNRMELLSVIKAIEFIVEQNISDSKIKVYSDSQYVVRLTDRKEKLKKAGFITKGGKEIQNKDLIKQLIQYIEEYSIEFIKVKAHQKKTETRNINREVDKLSRKIVRHYVNKNF